MNGRQQARSRRGRSGGARVGRRGVSGTARGGHSMPDHDKYQLRPRASRPRSPRSRRAPQPLSKYRRKTANARERSRMREINRAFEALRRAVPAAAVQAVAGAPLPCEKLTKITTLRLAMRYISALAAALRETDSPPWPHAGCASESDFSLETDPSEPAEDSLSPFDSFFAEFECDYVDVDRTFA